MTFLRNAGERKAGAFSDIRINVSEKLKHDIQHLWYTTVTSQYKSGVYISSGVNIKSGVNISSGVYISSGVNIKSGVNISSGVYISSGVNIKSGVNISPRYILVPG